MSTRVPPPVESTEAEAVEGATIRLDPLLQVRWARLGKVARELSPFLHPVRRLLLLAILCSTGNVLMTIARPWPIKMVLDYALLPAGRVKWVFPYHLLKGYGAMGVASIACGLLIAITLLWGLFAYNQRFLIAAAGQRVTYDLRRRLFDHLQRQSLSFHRRQRVGDLLLRATGDTNMLREMLVDAVLIVFTEFFVLLAMLAVMTYMDWQLTMVSLAILPLLGLAVFQISGRLRTAVRSQRKREGRVASIFGEMLQSIAVIQVFGREAHEQERFGGSNRRSLREGLRTVRLEANLERISEVMIAVGTGAVLWFGVGRVLDGALTPGDLVVFTSYLAAMYRPLRRIARVTGRLSKATVCAERVFSILRLDDRVKVRRDAVAAPRFRGRVTFKNVSFSYHSGQLVLRDVSFTITPRQTVAVVGPNGSGKSTLCALIPRLFDPANGSITIDGQKLSHFTLESLREQIGVVLQHPLLFAGSVRENVAYGKPDATDEEIVAAAAAVAADEFVRSLRDGYDTKIGERGDTLSGGQRQKLALARAIIKAPSILVLDEPTASLDAASAAQVNHSLCELSRNRTTLWVSHRLRDLQHADLILVLEDGHIAQRGTHDALMRQGGWYRDTYRLQALEPQPVEAAPALAARGGGS
jgi:ATP-binding cassette subfamily B protein/subfamily B ATP-binding cassette protein MsbA